MCKNLYFRSVAHGGQILFLQTTYELLQYIVANEISMLATGEHRLKDFLLP